MQTSVPMKTYSVNGNAEYYITTGLCRLRETKAKVTTFQHISAYSPQVVITGTYEYETRLEAVGSDK